MPIPVNTIFSGVSSAMLLCGAGYSLDTTIGATGAFKPVIAQTSIVASNYTVSGQIGTAILSNNNRKQFQIQNLSTGSLYVSFQTGASALNFNVCLGGAVSVDDGKSLPYINTYWQGPVSVSGNAPRFISFELT